MKALRILVVEDEAVIGLLYEELLVAMGHVVCAIEATEIGAVAAAVRLQPDLMIVDGKLGSGCGVSAVDAILRTLFIPHLFVSGDTSRIEQLKPSAVIVKKPFLARDLSRAMTRALAVLH